MSGRWFLLWLSLHLGDALSPREFVERHARQHGVLSAYTVLPVRDGHMLALPFHLRRLEQSIDELTGRDVVPDGIIDAAVSRALVPLQDESRSGFLTLCVVPTTNGELNVDALFTPSDIVTTLSAAKPFDGIIVDTVVYQRGKYAAKYSLWTLERKPLEANQRSGASETVLVEEEDAKTFLLEGLTSNLFVIENGVVVTPSDGVLQGSMAHLVQQHCKKSGVAVSLRKPCLADSRAWTALFLTSKSNEGDDHCCTSNSYIGASRPMLPVSRLYHGSEDIMINTLEDPLFKSLR